MPKAPGGIDFSARPCSRARVPVPAGVTRGQYNVEVYLFRGGQMVSAQSTPLVHGSRAAWRGGCSIWRTNAPFTYGMACVLMAMLLGWISSVLFQRPT